MRHPRRGTHDYTRYGTVATGSFQNAQVYFDKAMSIAMSSKFALDLQALM